MAEVNSPWMTLREGAKYLRIREERFKSLVVNGLVPSYEDAARYAGGNGARRMVYAPDLDRFMFEHREVVTWKTR